MRLVHPALSAPVLLDEGRVSVLAIESAVLFREMVTDMLKQCEGISGSFLLSRDFEPVAPQKEINLIQNPLQLDFEQRQITTKIISSLESAAVSEFMFEKTVSFQSTLSAYLLELLATTDMPLCVDEDVKITALLKAVALHIDREDANPAELISLYMDLISELRLANLFVFINLKPYLCEEELHCLYTSIRLKRHRVLLLESSLRDECREEERTLLIDKNLCEVINEFD